ncbi:MAG: CHAT domain-containing tetratricopeptide repeat protein [Pyrinomonadaceae bacterium]
MHLEELASELLTGKTENANERIAELPDELRLALAKIVREGCYASWSTEPVVAQTAADIAAIISETSESKEIEAIAIWIRGIAEITEGNLNDALEHLRSAGEIFSGIGLEHDAAQTQVAKLIPLGLLGEYDRAIEVGLSALQTFEKLGDTVAAGKIEINLSNISARQGRHEMARSFCTDAARRFAEAGETEWEVMAQNGLANTLAEINEFQEAEAIYKEALATAKKADMHLTEAEILASIGNLETYRGRFGDALKYLELSRRSFENLRMPHQSAVADLEMGEIYQILNLTAEASEIYSAVIPKLKSHGLRSEEARTRVNFARLLLESGSADTALAELQRADELYTDEDDPSGSAKVCSLNARTANILGDHEEALEQITRAEEYLSKGCFPRLIPEFLYLKGETLRLLRDFEQGAEILTECAERAKALQQPQIEMLATVALAKIAFENDREKDTEEYLKRAVEMVESLREPIPAEEFRMSFLADKLAPFELLAGYYISSGRYELAFEAIERARARTLLESMSASAASGERTEYENLRQRLNWHYSKLAREPENGADARAEISRLEDELSLLKLRDSSLDSASELSTRFHPEGETLKSVFSKLGQKTLIEYVSFEGTISAFVLNGDEVRYFQNLTDEDSVIGYLEKLKLFFGTMKYPDSLSESQHLQLRKRIDLCLERLYDLLIAPLEEELEGAVVIVPVSVLYYVPFQALFDGENYMIEAREIVLSPSAAIWSANSERVLLDKRKSFVMSFSDEGIPYADMEARNVSKLLGDIAPFCGEESTINRFVENSADVDIIHLACHGEFRADNPQYSNLRLADGFLTVGDIANQKLGAKLVTLSACETGLNKIYAGDEILGLARGFLSAGARGILMSLWTVNDKSTSMLMSSFYKHLEESTTPATALRAAVREMITESENPYHWAAFVIIEN